MTVPGAILDSLAARAHEVESTLDALLPAANAYPSLIHRAMRYSVLGGGKRLRAVLVTEAASLGSTQSSSGATVTWDHMSSDQDIDPAVAAAVLRVGPVAAAAAAVEMVHAYSLIHDDLPCMDDDDMRRGKPSNHKVYGEGIAVLAGDALLTLAFEVVAALPAAGVPYKTGVLIAQELGAASGSRGLIGGQVADLQSESGRALPQVASESELSRSELLHYIHRHKTGALFRACLRIGGLLGGLSGDSMRRITGFADSFGLAFQIVDDILDVEGETEDLGKMVGSDEKRGKLTYPALYGLAEAKAAAEREIAAAVEALEPFGERAQFLQNLAVYIGRRRS